MFLFTHGYLSGIRLFQSNSTILSTAGFPGFFQSFLHSACSYSCPRLCETIAQVSGPAAVTVLSKAAVALLSECCLRGPAAVKPAMIPALGFALRRFPKLCLVAELGFMGYVSNQNRRNLGKLNHGLSVVRTVYPCLPHFDQFGLKKIVWEPFIHRAITSQRLAGAPDSPSPLTVLKHGLACESSSMAANVLRLRTAEVFAGLASSYQEAAPSTFKGLFYSGRAASPSEFYPFQGLEILELPPSDHGKMFLDTGGSSSHAAWGYAGNFFL